MNNYDIKREALISLIKEAVWESERPDLETSPFSATEFPLTPRRDTLISALQATDALSVLGRIFDEEVAI